MENIDKIKCVLIDFEQNEKTLDEAANEILRLFSVVGSALLSDLIKEQIVSSPIRFNGVHIENIKQVFEKNGIKYDVGF